MSQEGQNNGALRLAGHGASRFSGRLEIFYNGEWGTICAADVDAPFSDFGYQAGSVACRQMGLGNVVDVYTIHNLPELRYVVIVLCVHVNVHVHFMSIYMYSLSLSLLSLSLSFSLSLFSLPPFMLFTCHCY